MGRNFKNTLEELPDDAENLFRTQENAALANAFGKVLSKAGLEPWEKLFQNLRSSCENDWIAQGIPAHVVAAWMGHSVDTQATHYLRILPEYFERVTQ